jgi:transcription elongation factor GreA
MDKEPITQQGYQNVTAEFKRLKEVEKPAILKAVDSARQLGDLKENAEYHAAREDQKNCEAQISELSDYITKLQVIDPSILPHNRVSFGSSVTLLDLDEEKEVKYTIVGGYESDPDRGLISYHSPLSRVLLGKEEGDDFVAKLPGGDKEFEIIKIEYKEIDINAGKD